MTAALRLLLDLAVSVGVLAFVTLVGATVRDVLTGRLP